MGADSPTHTDDAEAATEGFIAGAAPLVAGQSLGGRYQVVGRLGAGGMGEVWRAFDLKLRVEVALKALRAELATDERRLELLRSEVRAAREVTSPNVCRIYDLVEADGLELVSMEYVDGTTLLEVMRDKAPLDPPEAQQIASQFLAGLEAIHEAGLVHRDVKPENIMVTRTGRVVLMDFGLARSAVEGAGSVSGTPAYMAPEQARGVTDPRSDLFSAGVILAEMVTPEGIKSFESRQSVWTGIRSEPVQVPDSPWAPVVKKAVAKDPEERFQSARELTRALEEVAFRVHDETGLEPYPGLSSFDESDAEYFFGREAEVEAVWQKLESAQLLGIIGASGSGKSSFIGAGLVPSSPEGWSIVRCTPGGAAIDSLRESIWKVIQGDFEAVKSLAAGGDSAIVEAFGVWRQAHDNALLIVDQFEELFTQNTDEKQQRCAEILGKIALDSDVHVVLSMRDDFFVRCNQFEKLRPMYSEVTVLDPPHGSALRRAVVQPALRCGYRFEDEELADEILAEVEGERGALPLLAFALARLWQKRDRENGLITRQEYRDIGGVGGALAQHAEALMERLGPERHGIVREIFRNLVTAQGTRAARDTDELLSVFRENRDDAADVLRALIDARLLTSYEVPSDQGPGRQRVEVIHESLLTSWPRLVGWRTQDADAARLRDELRHATRQWDEHGRTDDRLWTGASYREYVVWRDRYPGGLTEIEEAFASAMTSLATRRRRRRRMAVAAAFTILLVGLAVVASFWRRSVFETRRAEASNLLSLARFEIEDYPTAAVAYATASLELADGPMPRRLALEALWSGPTAFVVREDSTWSVEFTPDGQWLIQVTTAEGGPSRLNVIGADGSSELLEDVYDGGGLLGVQMDRDTGHFASRPLSSETSAQFVLWSARERRKLAEARYDLSVSRPLAHRVLSSQQRMLVVVLESGALNVDVLNFDGTHERLGTIDQDAPLERPSGPRVGIDRRPRVGIDHRSGRWLGVVVGNDVFLGEIGPHGLSEPRRLGRVDGAVRRVAVGPQGRFLATGDTDGKITLWDVSANSPPRVMQGIPYSLGPYSLDFWDDEGSLLLVVWIVEGELEAWVWTLAEDDPRRLRRFDLGPAKGMTDLTWDHVGRRIVKFGPDLSYRLWSMAAPADAEPLSLRRGEVQAVRYPALHPQGHWLATSDPFGVALWPLARPWPSVIRRHREDINILLFAPDGRWLASASGDGTVRLWPLEGNVPPPGRVLLDVSAASQVLGLATSPRGDLFLAGSTYGAHMLSLDGQPPRSLPGFKGLTVGTAFSPDGSLAAAVGGVHDPAENVVRVWDVASGNEVEVLEREERLSVDCLRFTADGRILYASESELRRWNLETGEQELLVEGTFAGCAADVDGERLLLVETAELGDRSGRALFLDLETGSTAHLATHGDAVTSVALDPSGTLAVTGDNDGVVRVGPVTGEEPHLLLGHEHAVWSLAVDPRGRWIASGGADATVRLWPMPDLSKPPLHTLPRSELIAKLKTLTNLRVVRDEESATGWELTHDPFPGWETVPTW